MSWDWLLVVFGLLAVGMWCLDAIDTFTAEEDQ